MLADGGQPLLEEIKEEVSATVAPSTSSSALKVVEQIKTLTLWDKLQPFAMWLIIVIAVIVLAFIIRKIILSMKKK